MAILRKDHPTRALSARVVVRGVTVAGALALCALAGLWAGRASAAPSASPPAAPAGAPQLQGAGLPELTTLRLYGDSVVCDSCIAGQSNRPATAGADDVVDPNTGRVPEDPPYTDPRGPFSPLSDEAPRHDFVTWDPAWISERLGAQSLMDDWACANGLDEVSAASNIRAGGVNAAEKVWLRHWYEPTHLDKDLNADDCLSDDNLDGVPDAPPNPAASNEDEWYPAVMTELTYLLTENELPIANPTGDEVDNQAPRPACGAAGGTRWVFPAGTFADATDPLGPAEGQGLTSLDVDFDGSIDMINVSSERELANDLGLTIDFDGDGIVDDLDPAGPLSCDAMVVMHTDSTMIGTDGMLQFLDHYVRLVAANDNSATLQIWYNGDLQPRLVDQIGLGVGSAALASDVGPIPAQDRINAGGNNLGTVPRGAWFVYLDASDGGDNTATLTVGRALGAPCASMESAPNTANLSPGGPWHLKRFYVDGHEYNVTAIQTCSPTELQYLTLRAPLPKVEATIEQHSVRLQPYAELSNLVLPPPFNHEHTILEDVVVVAEEEIGPCPVFDPLANPFQTEPRPNIHYMGGPVGPVPPVLSDADGNRYMGRDPNRPVGPYQGADFFFASRWFYVDEDVNPQMLGQLREKYGAGRLGNLDLIFADFLAPDRVCEADGMGGFTCRDSIGTVGGSGGVATGDFNGDGLADAVFARGGFFAVPGTNQICLGDGAGNLACSDISADVDDTERVAVGDVDGDSNLDAVFANLSGPNRVCLGDGAGGFACSDVSADANDSADVALGFVNGDNALDAVFANALGVNRLCLGDGAGGFACSDVSADVNISDEVALGDLDGDGNIDAVFANILSPNRVCLGDGAGGFSCSDVEALARSTWGLALGDLDGDGVLDVVFANNDDVDDRVCFGNGDGTFTCGPDLEGGDGTTNVAVADLEADGDLDLVFATVNSPDRVCINEGAGTFDCRDVGGLINSNDVAIASMFGPQFPAEPFFFNEQMWTRPWNYTEFYLPDHTGFDGCDPDAYSVTTGFTNPTARWRLWSQPDGDVPDDVPPPPPDLVADNTGFDPTTGQYGAPRRAGFVYDPDRMDPVYTSQDGVRLHGGWPDCPDGDCAGAGSRPDVVFGAGDVLATDVAGYPVEVPPYTDPFAPFNPQAPDAPRGDLLTFNPAYMDEFRNSDEPLRALYQQLSNRSMNAREKVYQRAWYQPDYVTKIRNDDECETDLSFPAVMQEFTYLMMDTTDNPLAVPVPGSRIGFPIATGAGELPRPNLGGTLPAGGEFGHGLTSFDADFDGFPEAVGLHTEASANDYFSSTFAANRPQPPLGVPVLPLPGALVDFDGDGLVTDTLDADCTSLNGNEMVVMVVESIVLDAEDGDPTFGHAAQFLDHMVVAENVTGGANPRAQLRIYFAGGTVGSAVPEQVGGTRTLGVGSVAVVDRFQDSVRVIDPGESNAGLVDGAWFVFVEDVSEDGERVTLTLGRALGATHSAIDDGSGNHDLTPGDPWYLKRFYVDGHEYNVTALMTRTAPGADPTDPALCNDSFAFITIRTPVPKGNYFNPQDSLFQQGYFLDGLPPQMSVMPPFNVDHTIVRDVERIEAEEFANLNFFDACVGELAAAGPQAQVITEEEPELRFGQELRETYRPDEVTTSQARLEPGWETHQLAVTPGDYTEIALPEGETYLLTLNWRSEVSRLSFYGCTRNDPGPFDDENDPPAIQHDDVAAVAAEWDPALIPAVNRFDPPQRDEDNNGVQDIAPFFDARCSVTETVRVKLFYDPSEDDDLYVNKRPVDLPFLDIDAGIEKTASTSSPAAGSELVYTVVVTNYGPDDAPGAIVVDELPLGVSYVSDTDSCVTSGGAPEVLTCTLGPIASGASDAFDITVLLDDNLPPGVPLVNLASVTIPAALDNDPTNDTDDAVVTPVLEADLGVEKSAPSGSTVAGESLTYRIVATNHGPSFATGVLLTDTLPDGVGFNTTSRNDLCSFFGPDLVVCAVGDLAVGASITIDITVDVPAGVAPGTLLENVVLVDGERDDPNPTNDQDDADVIVVSVADLRLNKEASPNPVTAGERLTYTLTVDNDGPSDAPVVQVVDSLPAEVAYVSAIGASCAGVPVGGTGALTCQLGAIPAGGSAAFEIVVDVRADVPSGTVIDNLAVASGPGSTDPDPTNNDDDASVDVETEADLRLTKDGPLEVFPGTEFDWPLTIVNGGPSDAQNVVVSDTLPADTTYVSATGAACAGVAVGGTGTLVCTVGPLAAGASTNVVVRLRVDDDAVDQQVLTNTAIVGSDTPDPDSGNNDAVDTTIVRRLADLAIDKQALGAAVAGSSFVYDLDIQNAGPSSAVGVVVTDTLPAGATFDSSDPACNEVPPASGQLVCALPDLVAGGMDSVRITVTLAADLAGGALLTNRAGVDASTPDPDPSDNTDEVTSTVARQVDLTITIGDTPDPVTAGSSLRYTVTVENKGPSDASNVTVVDTLPPGTAFDTSDVACVQAPVGTLTCGLGGLPAGASTSFTIDVSVDPGVPGGTILIDQASVGADESETNPGDNNDSESTLVVAEADLAISKSAASATVIAGEGLVYTIVVTNTGPSDAPNVVVVDSLPAGTSFVSSTGGCLQAPVGTLTCSLGTLSAGASTSFTVQVDVDPTVPTGTLLTNLVTVDSDAADPNPGNNSDDADVTVRTEADLSIEKTGPAMVEPGQQLAYGLTVTNFGPSTAVGVIVTDTLPVSTTYVMAVGATCAPGGAPGEIVCDLGDLAASAMTAFNIVVMVDADAPEGLQLYNQAEVGADTPDPQSGNNVDDATTTVDPRFEADLRLIKEALEAMPGAGELFSYRITVNNDGPRAATNVLVTDTLPSGVSYEFDSDSCVEGPTGTLVCSLGTLVSGGSASFTITVRVDNDAAAGAVLSNTATTTSDLPDPDPSNNTDTAEVTVVPRVDLRVTIDDSVDPVAAGAQLGYVLLVENLGPSDATGVVVTHTLPAGVSYVSDDGACDTSALPLLTCAVGPLASGASSTINVLVGVPADTPDGATLLSDASVAGNEPDPAPGNNDDSETTDVVRRSDLAISKTASQATRAPGELLTYTLQVDNLGPSDATGVRVTDTLPAGLSYEGDNGGCDASGAPVILCSVGNLAAGASTSIQITVRVDLATPPGTQLENTAVVGGDQPDDVPGNNDDSVTTTVTPLADLRVDKIGFGEVVTGPNPGDISPVPGAVTAGRRITYTLTIGNGGPTVASGVSVTDTLPAGVSYVADDAGCDTFGLPVLRCDLGSLAAGASTTVTIVVDSDPGLVAFSVLENAVLVGGDDPDPDPSNNSDTHDTTVFVSADLSIEKTVDPALVTPGGQVTFGITVTNAGPSLARAVVVEDTLPMSVTYVSDTASCDTGSLPTLTCALGDLAPGAMTSFDIVAMVEAGLEGQTVSNTASVELTGGGADPDPSNNEDTANFDVAQEADLRISKTGTGEVVVPGSPPGLSLTPDAVSAGQRLTYTLHVTNTGPATAPAVVLTDTLPAGVSYVSDDAGCDASGAPVIVCALGALPAGGSAWVTLQVDVAVDVAEGDTLVNGAVVDGGVPDPNPGDNSTTQNTDVSAFFDLMVVKTADPSAVAVGETVTFTLTAANGGPAVAAGALVSDTLPPDFSYVSDDSGCDTSSLPVLSCSLGDLPPGAMAKVEITVRAEAGAAGQSRTNVARVGVSGGGNDADPSNDQDDADVDVRPLIDLSVDKAGAGEVVVPGSPPGVALLPNNVTAGRRLTYTLSVANAGPSTATGVVLTDTLPAGTSYVSASGASCSTVGLPTLLCNLPSLSPGGMVAVVVVVDVDADVADGAVLRNTTGVTANESESDDGNNVASQDTDVGASSDLSLAKTGDPAQQSPGGLVTYTLSIDNLGPSDAVGVVLTDTLPADVSYISDDAGCDTSALPQIVCTVGGLAAGGTASVGITVQVSLGAQAGATLTNNATVGADTPDPDPSNNDDDTSTTVVPEADLRVIKSATGEVVTAGNPPGITLTPDTVTAGRVLSYTLLVTNGGPSTATGVVLTDTLPAGMSHLSDDGGCDASAPPLVVCPVGALANGASATIIIRVAVDADIADGATRTNTVRVGGDVSDPDPGNDEDQQTTTVLASPDLAVVKSADPTVVTEGGTVIFTVEVSNNGPSAAAGATAIDTLPVGLSYVSDTGGCQTAGLPTLSCDLGPLAAGASLSFDIEVSADGGTAGSILTNTVTVVLTGGGSDPDPSNNTDEASVTVRAPQPEDADLAIDKSGEGEFVVAGDPPTVTIAPDIVTAGRRLTWTLAVSNAGPATATGVTVSDTLPAGVTFVSASVACDTSGLPLVVCALPDLSSGANSSFQIVADVASDVPDGSLLDNFAVVGGTAPDGNPANNEATYRMIVGAAADLVLQKTANPGQVAPGGVTTFTLTTTNLGPSVGDDLILIDTLPAGLAYVSDDGGCDTSALPTISCDLGDLVPGASITVQLVVQAVGATDTSWTNTGTVLITGGGTDPDPTNNTDSDDVDIVPVVVPVDLSLDKSGAGEFVTTSSPPGLAIVPGLVTAGRRLTYTLTVRNVGATPATGVTISDTLPAGVSFVSASVTCDISSAPVIHCDAPDLGPGAMATVVVAVDVAPDVPHFSVLTNRARVDADMPDSDPSNNSAQQQTTVFVVADLQLEKTADPGVVPEGGSVTFVLTTTNLGPSLARDVELSDTLPAGLSYLGDDGGCDTAALPLIVCDQGDLTPGASAVVHITAGTDPGTAGQMLTNVAVVALTGPGDDPDPSNNDASATVDVPPPAIDADLSLAKTGAGAVTQAGSPPTTAVVADQVSAGNRLTYTLSVGNAGPDPATGVIVTDTLPAGVSFVSAGVACDSSAAPLIVCSVGALGSGANTSFQMVVDVAPEVVGGTVLVNMAVVGGDQPDGDPSNNDAAQSTTVSELADLALSKTADPGVVAQSDPTTFTIRVDNLGPSLARGVQVIDTLPAGLTYLSDTAGCNTAGLPTLVCDLGDVAAGGMTSFQIVVRVDAPAPDMITNTATAFLTGGGSDPDPSNNSDSDTVEVVPVITPVDLALTKSGAGEVTTASSPPGTAVVPNSVTAGRRLTYTLSAGNVGATGATGVVVSDTLPAGVTFLSSSVLCDTSGAPVVRCDLGDLAPAAMAGVSIVVDVDAGLAPFSTLDNVAEVSADQPDSNPSNNDDSQTTTVLVSPDLAVVKTADPGVVPEGGSVTFVVTTTNLGASLARGVELVDTLPAGLSYTGDDFGCSTVGLPVLTCDLGDLAPGASATVRITATADGGTGGTTLTNLAVVALTGGGSDPDPSNNSDSAAVDVTPEIIVDLAVGKTGNGEVVFDGSPPSLGLVSDRVTAGRRLTYTLRVENVGLLGASNVVLSDTLPAAVSYVSDDAGCDTSGLPLLTCAVGSLASGASASVDVLVEVAADTLEGSQIVNRVSAQADEPELDLSNNDASQVTLVDVRADLSLSKSASPPWVTTGDSVTFAIEVTNNGPSLARSVRVTDTLPAGLSYVSDTAGCLQGPVGTLVCDLGDILPGASTAFDIVVSVGGGLFGSTLTNTATAGSLGGGSDPDPSNDTDSASVRVVDPANAADLSIKKSITETLPIAGELITYTVFVVNNGPALAVDPVVSDTLTSTDLGAVRLITSTLGGACVLLDDYHLDCDLPDIPSGGAIDYKVTGQLLDVPEMGDPSLHFTNTVIVSSSTPDLDLSNNEGFAFVEILPDAFMMNALLFAGTQASLLWEDALAGEVDYQIQGRAGRAPFAPLAVVPSPDGAGAGRALQWLSEPLPAGRDYVFRIIARDAEGKLLAAAARSLRIPARPRAETACVDGQVVLPGRGQHVAWLAVDGLPLEAASASGAFRLCGLPPGSREVVAFRDGWLQTRTRLSLSAGGTRELPLATLPAGDHDRSGRIDVADLARVSARVGLEPVDPRADLDGDGRVTRGDVALVSEWLDSFAPAPWGSGRR